MKPVVWSRPGAAAAAAVVFAWLASIELGSSRTASRDAAVGGGSGETVVDTSTSRHFDVAALASLVIGLGASLLVPSRTIRARRLSFATGIALLVASGGLSGASRRRLGRFHRDALTVHDDHRVVDTGPYRRVRHPLYLATMGVFTGTGAVLGNWVSVAGAAIPAAALARRIVVEEHMLVEHLGDEYRFYQDRTSRLIPGVW